MVVGSRARRSPAQPCHPGALGMVGVARPRRRIALRLSVRYLSIPYPIDASFLPVILSLEAPRTPARPGRPRARGRSWSGPDPRCQHPWPSAATHQWGRSTRQRRPSRWPSATVAAGGASPRRTGQAACANSPAGSGRPQSGQRKPRRPSSAERDHRPGVHLTHGGAVMPRGPMPAARSTNRRARPARARRAGRACPAPRILGLLRSRRGRRVGAQGLARPPWA
jgi:hypothetical protein